MPNRRTEATVTPIRSNAHAAAAICPFHPNDTGTLYIFKRSARDFYMCFGCGSEGYAIPNDDASYRLRIQQFQNIRTTKTSRVARP